MVGASVGSTTDYRSICSNSEDASVPEQLLDEIRAHGFSLLTTNGRRESFKRASE
jgi:hypothetical protein